MKLVMLGAPGSGKGTHGMEVAEYLKVPHVSTGDMFRDNINKKTPLGLKVKSIIDAGNFCPDDITIEIVKNRLSEEDCKNGFVLDGFPRNLVQAEALEEFASIDKVINLSIPTEKLEQRLSGRRICSECKKSFNTQYIGETKVCPDCGGKLITREDDKPESVRERIKVYFNQTEPLIDFYTKKNKLVNIDSDRDIKEVSEDIKKVF